jgi:plasmid stabilization system protein ParE
LVVEIGSAIERIQRTPSQFPKLAFDARRMVLGRFPYVVVFRQTQTEIEIVAVAHGRRRPGYRRERLSGTSH